MPTIRYDGSKAGESPVVSSDTTAHPDAVGST
jgi:hypothetical protein